METTINVKTTATVSNVKSASVSKSSWYDRVIEKATFNYFGLVAIAITVGSIVGGIAAMYIFQNDAPIWQLGVAMSMAMANNVAAIGQAPVKWLVNLFAAATIVNLLIILANVL